MNCEIEDYSPSDQDLLVRFYSIAFKELGHDFLLGGKDKDLTDIPNHYQRNGGAFYIAKLENQIVGSIGLRRLNEATLELKRFYVLKERQRLGMGTALITKAIEHASQNCCLVRLDTTHRAPAALSLFRKVGFQEIDRYNDDPYAEIFMELKIKTTIRPESTNDKEGIRNVLTQAFPTSAEADLVDRLRNNNKLRISLVAVENETIVGQICFSDVRLEDSGTTQIGLGLGPVTVLPSHQKKGIGSSLILKGFEIATQQKVPFVVVLGSRKYYTRFGFELAQKYNISSTYNMPKNFMIHYLGQPAVTFKKAMAYYVDEFNGL